jgi:hypothetical protein
VVRDERFEVVDDGGRVRAVLGALDDGAVGLALFAGDGRERVRLAVDDDATFLSLTATGNVVLEAGWLDPTGDVARHGGYLFLARADGTPVAGWRVGVDGTITPLGPSPP